MLYSYHERCRKRLDDVIDALKQADPSLLEQVHLDEYFTDYLELALKSVTDEQAQAFFEAYEKSKDADHALQSDYATVKRIIQDRLGGAPLHVKKLEPKTVPHGLSFGPPGLPPSYPGYVSSHPSSSSTTTTTTTSDLPFRSSIGSGPFSSTEEPGLLNYPTRPLLPVIDPDVEEIGRELTAGNLGRVAAIISREKPKES